MKKRSEENTMRDKIEISLLMTIFMISILAISNPIDAAPITHKFKNPSFSGQGTGAH